ncbi:cytochrome P450 family protein [Streptomyces violascens]|uniref:cytochrome P450 family protein n=1 Tax=Streptomyces violascens TaxID=67381 RepID=UPI001671C1FE|nr:cytochrome P450 [Streptomyces violascens]GGU38375.1 cytochrome P450 [Streptomyces violascens]
MEHQPTTPIVLDLTGADHHGEHETLRASGPAVLVDILGVTAWSITDPALLKTLLTSPDVSKDGRAHWPDFQEVIQTWPLNLWVGVNNMFTAYGSDHRRLRRIIAPAFAARRIADLTCVVEAIVTDILDHLATFRADETVDLREHLAYPLPIAVIGHLMGVPADQRTVFRTLADGIFDTTLSTKQQQANTKKLYAALKRLIVAKRSAPGDDMTSLLIAARDEEGDGHGLSDAELRDTLLLMITAGYETTVNVIDQAISLLLTHPEQLHRVQAGAARWNDVVEESLRLEPAVKHLPLRYAVKDIQLPDGQTIAAGEAILASYAAANRHPDWHGESADVFDISRVSKDHLAFGYGVHFCLGAPLARLEVATALRMLFTRFPRLELAVPATQLRPQGSLISNGHKSLPAQLGPSAA